VNTGLICVRLHKFILWAPLKEFQQQADFMSSTFRVKQFISCLNSSCLWLTKLILTQNFPFSGPCMNILFWWVHTWYLINFSLSSFCYAHFLLNTEPHLTQTHCKDPILTTYTSLVSLHLTHKLLQLGLAWKAKWSFWN
jgi:hypothetical protein